MKNKKECTCYKIVKNDKVTLITECETCKKHRLKALKLIKEILVLANELQKKQDVKVPEYKKGVTFSEVFEKVKNEDFVLRNAYNEIEKSMPFARPLSEEPKKETKYFVKVNGKEYEIDKPICFDGIYKLKK